MSRRSKYWYDHRGRRARANLSRARYYIHTRSPKRNPTGNTSFCRTFLTISWAREIYLIFCQPVSSCVDEHKCRLWPETAVKKTTSLICYARVYMNLLRSKRGRGVSPLICSHLGMVAKHFINAEWSSSRRRCLFVPSDVPRGSAAILLVLLGERRSRTDSARADCASSSTKKSISNWVPSAKTDLTEISGAGVAMMRRVFRIAS